MRDLTPKQATRQGQYLRMAIDGPSGAGKTWTSLLVAKTMVDDGRTLVIDTERGSSELYSDDYTFDVAHWEPPYDPNELQASMRKLAADYDVIIIDSATHFWNGEGGVLEIVDQTASKMGGNSWAGWSKGTPAYRALIDALTTTPAHVIVTMRSKTQWVEQNGKPKKVGLAPEQRAGIEYEFTIVGSMDHDHTLTIGKTRYTAIADKAYPSNRITECIESIQGWLSTAEPLLNSEDLDTIRAMIDELPDAEKPAARAAVRQQFGEPRLIKQSQFEEVRTALNDILDQAAIDQETAA